ncbi:MAG TPA: RidA family protein [Balneolaceae bacterium]|nr:RidA family protein [Balneolaceae bacterium]
MKEIIKTGKAPQAIGPYSQAVVYDNIIYASGQIALNPETMEIVKGGIDSQTKRVMDNIEAILVESKSDFSKVIKCSIFLADMNDFAKVNEIYGSYFQTDPPARETVAVKTLPKNVLVEISCIAYQ